MPSQSATRRVYLAYQRAALEYSRYSDVCQNMPVKPQAGRILYVRGRGFEVNGKTTRMTATQLVDYYDGLADYYIELINKNCGPLEAQASKWSENDLYTPLPKTIGPEEELYTSEHLQL